MNTNVPRLFCVTWTNARKNTRDLRRHDSNEAFGTQYPNGFVTLDNGASFETLGELRHFLDEHGVHSLQFLDEGESVDEVMVRRIVNDQAMRIVRNIRMSGSGQRRLSGSSPSSNFRPEQAR